MPRPPLPRQHANTFIPSIASTGLPPVKYQILTCGGKDILVGRLKIETQTSHGHAFILRRFDTNALSLTTMFRAAFPSSSEQEERTEINWVKEKHDLSGNNGSSKDPHIVRLAGTWVSPELALELARDYGMVELIKSMVEASPDPQGNYRRSNKSQGNAYNNAPKTGTATPTKTPTSKTNQARVEVTQQQATFTTTTVTSTPKALNGTPSKPPSSAQKPPSKSLPTPSPTGASGPPPSKRRKEASPVPTPDPEPEPVPSTPASKLPRRSARTKSPAPSRGPQPLTTGLTTTSVKPKSRSSVAPPTPKKRAADVLPKVPSPVKGVDDAAVEENVAGMELYEQDIQEQKKLIDDLKAAKAKGEKKARAAKEEREEEEEQDEDEAMEDEEESGGPSKLKRARQDEEEQLAFNFKEPETEERQIASNRRVQGRFNMQPRTKSLAWGLAAFAVGMGAVSFLPNFF